MKARSGSGLASSLLGGLGLLMLGAGLTTASDGKDSGRQIAVTLNAGETYLIKDLSTGATPAVHVMDNPNALIVNSGKPGELALVGESAGLWKIDVETAAGDRVSYKVAVAEIGDPDNHLRGKSNGSIPKPSNSGSAPDKPVARAALDAGSGLRLPMRPAPARSATVATSSAPSALVPVMLADATSATSSTSPPQQLKPIGPASATASAPTAAPTTLAAASSSTLPPVSGSGSDETSISSTMGGNVMPSQSPQAPRRFRVNPPAPTPGDSVNGGTHYLPEDVVELSAGSSMIYDFPRRIRRISIADTSVADIQVVNPFQINLVGHKEGFTTLAVWDTRGQYQERQIRVDPFGRQQVMLNVIVSELNRSRMEAQGIDWSVNFTNYNFSVLGLPGGLSSVNQGAVLPPTGLIPLLLSTNVNYAVTGQGQGVTTESFFNFLEQHNLAKILAEPHLLANSGEKAEFLSGGEIPIVLAQALNTSIVFKEFGTSVVFVPTVIGKEDIGLEVKPEVSQPDFAHGVNLFGFTVPAFVTRRAQTFVRLKNNQTLIIAGLLLRTRTSFLQKTPYLGDIPYLGYLFKRTTYQDQQSDLVMSVTPQIIAPIAPGGEPILPTERPQFTADELRTRRLQQEDTTRPRF